MSGTWGARGANEKEKGEEMRDAGAGEENGRGDEEKDEPAWNAGGEEELGTPTCSAGGGDNGEDKGDDENHRYRGTPPQPSGHQGGRGLVADGSLATQGGGGVQTQMAGPRRRRTPGRTSG